MVMERGKSKMLWRSTQASSKKGASPSSNSPEKELCKGGALEIGENFFIILAVLCDKVLNQNLDIYLLL